MRSRMYEVFGLRSRASDPTLPRCLEIFLATYRPGGVSHFWRKRLAGHGYESKVTIFSFFRFITGTYVKSHPWLKYLHSCRNLFSIGLIEAAVILGRRID